MSDDPRDPSSNIIDFMRRAANDAAVGLPYSEKIFIGGRLLTVITIAAKALTELESEHVNRVLIDDQIRLCADALQDVGAALRNLTKHPRH